MSSPAPAPRRARHLIDPDNPRPRATAKDAAELSRVQRWVMSVLAVTTILHLSAGLAIAAIFVGAERMDARVGLNVIAAGLGVVAVATGFLIHQRSPFTWWLLLGLTPGLIGAWLTFS